MAILVGCLLVCALWAVTAAMLIARELDRRGMPVSFVWLRLMILKYVYQYVKITRQETGRIGPLFYHYVVPLNVALVLAVAMLVIL
jgi:hypothetical protein